MSSPNPNVRMWTQELPDLDTFSIDIGTADLAIVTGLHQVEVPTLYVECVPGILTINSEGGQLRITRGLVQPPSGHRSQLAIELPEGGRHLGSNYVGLTSGRVAVEQADMDSLYVRTSGFGKFLGHITVKDSKMESANLNTRKGNITVTDSQIPGRVVTQQDWGNFLAENSAAGQWEVKIIEGGDIHFENVQGPDYSTTTRGQRTRHPEEVS